MTVEHAISAPSSDTQAPIISVAKSAQRPLRICVLGYRSAPFGGGQGIYIKYLSKALLEYGHSVDVISGPPYPHLDPGVRLIKMPSLDLFENGLTSLRPRHLRSMSNIIEWTSKLTGGFAEPYTFGRRVVKYLRENGHHYDLIHDNQSLSYGMLQLQEMGFPLVTTVHHPVTNDLRLALNAATGFKHRLLIKRWHSFLRMQKKVVKQLRHIVTVSEQSQYDIADDFGISRKDVQLIYNGIDTEVFQPRPEIERLPYRLMATASADQPLKGLRYLLEAVAMLRPRYPDIELLVVGRPQEGGETEKLIERLGIGDRLRFVSGISTEKLVDYYAEAALAVVPSLYEGFGLPAGEAMACGLPVVSTRGGALPEVVGDAGVLVGAGDARAIAVAVEDLLDNPDRRAELGQQARQRILDKFCWNLAARQMSDYYYRVLASANG